VGGARQWAWRLALDRAARLLLLAQVIVSGLSAGMETFCGQAAGAGAQPGDGGGSGGGGGGGDCSRARAPATL
jgi:hypothetical protein